MTQTQSLTWGRSARDGIVHAFTDHRWCGDAIALCQHACTPQHVDCAGQGLRCRTASTRQSCLRIPDGVC